jgi:hypothetical protein
VFSRFRIEDLISQDSASVVYLGVDEKTGEWAALRRFFLRSGGSVGIAEEDQAAFSEAIALLSEVQHPSLRRVLEGGLDEVDGVPYVATEWAEGLILRDILANEPLSPADGELLVRQGLDVAEHMESFFGVGAHWLKIHPDSVILKASGEGKMFTFSISLDRWMGIEHGEDGLHELANLVEEACGLKSAVAVGEGGGLGEWVRQVRETSPSISAAREALDLSCQKVADAPAAAAAPVISPAAPPVSMTPAESPVLTPPQGVTSLPPTKKHGMAIMLAVVGVILLLAASAFLYVKTQRDKADVASVTKTEGTDEASLVEGKSAPASKEVVPEARELAASTGGDRAEVPVEPEPVVSAEEERPAPGSVAEKAMKMREELAALKARTEFQADEGALLSARKGDEVMVVGEVQYVRETKEWLVFEFTKTRGPNVLNVRLKKANAPDLTLEEIESHEGQTRRFRGIVGYYWAARYNRVFLEIDSLESLSEE